MYALRSTGYHCHYCYGFIKAEAAPGLTLVSDEDGSVTRFCSEDCRDAFCEDEMIRRAAPNER